MDVATSQKGAFGISERAVELVFRCCVEGAKLPGSPKGGSVPREAFARQGSAVDGSTGKERVAGLCSEKERVGRFLVRGEGVRRNDWKRERAGRAGKQDGEDAKVLTRADWKAGWATGRAMGRLQSACPPGGQGRRAVEIGSSDKMPIREFSGWLRLQEGSWSSKLSEWVEQERSNWLLFPSSPVLFFDRESKPS